MLKMLESRLVILSKRCSELPAPGQQPKVAMMLHMWKIPTSAHMHGHSGSADAHVAHNEVCQENDRFSISD